jgi:hypothetical protein
MLDNKNSNLNQFFFMQNTAKNFILYQGSLLMQFFNLFFMKTNIICLRIELNYRQMDFQSIALPLSYLN